MVLAAVQWGRHSVCVVFLAKMSVGSPYDRARPRGRTQDNLPGLPRMVSVRTKMKTAGDYSKGRETKATCPSRIKGNPGLEPSKNLFTSYKGQIRKPECGLWVQ